jgi:plasmid stabilization system protein ParE
VSQLVLEPAAFAEAASARAWYAEHSARSADAFEFGLAEALGRIMEAPERWPIMAAGIRRYVLRSHPFLIFYVVSDETVKVLAIAHASRRPDYWRRRGSP